MLLILIFIVLLLILVVVYPIIKNNSDLQKKRDVYLIIAKFIEEIFNQPLTVCIGATHLLCEETNQVLLKDGVIDNESKQLAISAKKILLVIKVTYESLKNNRNYIRKVEIFWLKNDKPTSFKVETEIDWDYLHPDIRESNLREGIESVRFKLYPQEK